MIPPVRITISGGKLGDPARVIPANLERRVTELMLFLEREVKIRTPIGVTEAARGSIGHEVRVGEPAGVGAVVGLLGSPLAHVRVQNDGRRPGEKMPPPEALELWVRRKLKIERRYKAKSGEVKARTRNGVTLTRPPTVAEARGLAYVIARAIGERGMEGRHFFEAAVQENESRIRRLLEGAGLQITIDIAGKS